jgi:hypothetical protein
MNNHAENPYEWIESLTVEDLPHPLDIDMGEGHNGQRCINRFDPAVYLAFLQDEARQGMACLRVRNGITEREIERLRRTVDEKKGLF